MISRLIAFTVVATISVAPLSAQEFAATPAGMLIGAYESDGCRNIPNFHFDKRHTAGGCYQITETNWQRYAPLVGIDTAVRPNALTATEQEQGMVAGWMWAKEGCLPWAPFNPKLASAGLCDLRGSKPASSAATIQSLPIARMAEKSPVEVVRPVKRHEWHDEDDTDQQEEPTKP